jgi:hypothetical protein
MNRWWRVYTYLYNSNMHYIYLWYLSKTTLFKVYTLSLQYQVLWTMFPWQHYMYTFSLQYFGQCFCGYTICILWAMFLWEHYMYTLSLQYFGQCFHGNTMYTLSLQYYGQCFHGNTMYTLSLQYFGQCFYRNTICIFLSSITDNVSVGTLYVYFSPVLRTMFLWERNMEQPSELWLVPSRRLSTTLLW